MFEVSLFRIIFFIQNSIQRINTKFPWNFVIFRWFENFEKGDFYLKLLLKVFFNSKYNFLSSIAKRTIKFTQIEIFLYEKNGKRRRGNCQPSENRQRVLCPGFRGSGNGRGDSQRQEKNWDRGIKAKINYIPINLIFRKIIRKYKD